MRFVRVVLALIFGLAVAGPETHACPVHSPTPASAHHQDGSTHHKAAHCTCPQACCPAGGIVSISAHVASWTPAPLPVITVDLEANRGQLLPQRKHLLPFALAPPLA